MADNASRRGSLLLTEGWRAEQKAPVSQGGGSARQTQSYVVASALSLFTYCGTHFPFQPICNLWTCSRPIMCSSEGRPAAPALKQIYRRCSRWLAATCACASAHGEAAPELTAVLGYANESLNVESRELFRFVGSSFADIMESKNTSVVKCARLTCEASSRRRARYSRNPSLLWRRQRCSAEAVPVDPWSSRRGAACLWGHEQQVSAVIYLVLRAAAADGT